MIRDGFLLPWMLRLFFAKLQGNGHWAGAGGES